MKKTTLFLAALCAGTLLAEVKLDPVFSSDMILQQEKDIPFFGTADPGEKITAEFAGKNLNTTAGNDGSWQVDFPAMKADNKPYTAKFSGKSNSVELTNLKLGEVWFCSGQSNMYMRLGNKFIRGTTVNNCEVEHANANYPDIRLAFQKMVYSHLKEIPAAIDPFGKWVPCSPKTVVNFSAAGYFFARKIHKDLNIPVGVIKAAWGGTPAEPWISDDGFRTAGLQKELQLIDRFKLDEAGKKEFEAAEKARYLKQLTAWYPHFEKAGADAKARAFAAGWDKPDFDDSKWKPAKWVSLRKYTVRWYRMNFRLFSWMRNKPLQLIMPKGGDFVEVFINGKKVAEYLPCIPEEEKKIDVTLPAELFNARGSNQISVRAGYFHRGPDRSSMINLLERTGLKVDGKTFVIKRKWKECDEFAISAKKLRKNAPKFISIPYHSSVFPSNLYNSMVTGWTRLPVRGILWYQGCARAGDPRYYLLLKALINDWRKQWKNPEMPFIIVQLAGYGPERKKDWQTFIEPAPRYAMARDCQQQMLELPNVGLITAIDIGEVDNIHPGNKQDVGFRLALEAERMVYGKNVVSRGPMFKEAKVENGRIRVYFTNTEGGLKTSDGKAPGAFYIAGSDKKFVLANAVIDGNTVIVSAPEVKNPAFVRYAYVSFRGDCNLQNGHNLPAFPFRSDAYEFHKLKP
ncbi:MAG: beta galactosidase jelly roll domain-containing protein [Lentisphaeria bacterium]|nr:beta galactosidase jelly roll domain-containing protein [Lentisphaeria bacterium]